MLITEFETLLQNEVDKDITIRINPNAEDVAGVYYKGMYIGVALPPLEIKEEYSEKYHDRMGHAYRTKQQALDLIKGKLTKFKDPEVMRVMSEKL